MLQFTRSAITLVAPEHLAIILPATDIPRLPFIAGYVVTTDDGNDAAAALLTRSNVAFMRRSDELIVPAQAAGGATLVFSARPTSSS